MIEGTAPARVGLLGNPSDGYGGRTLALAVPRFAATVTAEPDDGLVLAPGPADPLRWASPADLASHVDRYGYGTGTQLLAATVRSLLRWCADEGLPLPTAGVRLAHRTTIPRQVGLAGSSALVVAALRALCRHWDLVVPPHLLPSVALRAETTELGLTAGLQDRVVQCRGGLVAMDFSHLEHDPRHGLAHGRYEALDPVGLPPLFLAWREGAAEPSSTYHRQLRQRYEAGDGRVRQGLRELAALVVEGRAALRWRDHDRFAQLVGRNMELRRGLAPLPEGQLALVEVAAGLGCAATFAGSGGAVVGVLSGPDRLDALEAAYAPLEASVVAVEGPGSP